MPVEIIKHIRYDHCIMQVMLYPCDNHGIGAVIRHFYRFTVLFFIVIDDIIG